MSRGRPRAPIRVLVADDDPALLASIASLLEDESSFELVATAADADEAIALAIRLRPDVALVDVRMPGGGGPRATSEILAGTPETAVIALSADGDRDSVLRMIAAGSSGYILKGGSAREILEALERAAHRESLLSGGVTGHVLTRLSGQLRTDAQESERRAAQQNLVNAALEDGGIEMYFQPVVRLVDGRPVGYEALARFTSDPRRPPNLWFSDAQDVGMRAELELSAIERALSHIDQIPFGNWLSLNASPDLVSAGTLDDALGEVDASRVVLEVTEDAPIDDYDRFAAGLLGLRSRGLRLAVDDAGAGFASLRHILRLAPDIIKLDRTLIDDVDSSRASRAMAAAFVSFAGEVDTTVLAEGIEHPAARDAARPGRDPRTGLPDRPTGPARVTPRGPRRRLSRHAYSFTGVREGNRHGGCVP